MARFLCFLLTTILCALAALPWFRVPTIAGWKLAILATEFGHVFAVAAVFTGGWSWSLQRRGTIGRMLSVGAVACGIAALSLASTSFRAWSIGQDLGGDMTEALGGPINGTPIGQRRVVPFRYGALWSRVTTSGPKPATHVYAKGEGYELALDFYPATSAVPATPRDDGDIKRVPCIVVVHGGGWDNGDRTVLAGMNHWLASQGFAVASVDYRLAPKWTWPAPRDDVQAALVWLRSHADELGIDHEKLFLLGRSAGGQIALDTAYRDGRTSGVRGVIALYSPADLNFAYRYGREDDVLKSLGLLRAYLGGTPDERHAAYDDASPILRADASVPPTLLIHGRLDTLVWDRQSERLDERLAEVGAPHFFLRLPWATHAFDYNLSGPGGQLSRWAILGFLRRFSESDTPTVSAPSR